MDGNNFEPPEGVYNYDTAAEVPAHIQKYWHQRHKIFSKYDEGVWLTEDAWFGVTPEPVADKIAEHVATTPVKSVIIDAFAGAGGNVIAFARSGRWEQIFAVEKDPKVLACAKHNAELYGVGNKIWWVEGDIFDVLKRQLKRTAKDAVIFASPPWGGPGYSENKIFDLSTMQPYSIEKLYDSLTAVTSDVVLFLPRTSDLRQIAEFANGEEKLDVVHYCMHGASKALCVFLGEFYLPVDGARDL